MLYQLTRFDGCLSALDVLSLARPVTGDSTILDVVALGSVDGDVLVGEVRGSCRGCSAGQHNAEAQVLQP